MEGHICDADNLIAVLQVTRQACLFVAHQRFQKVLATTTNASPPHSSPTLQLPGHMICSRLIRPSNSTFPADCMKSMTCFSYRKQNVKKKCFSNARFVSFAFFFFVECSVSVSMLSCPGVRHWCYSQQTDTHTHTACMHETKSDKTPGHWDKRKLLSSCSAVIPLFTFSSSVSDVRAASLFLSPSFFLSLPFVRTLRGIVHPGTYRQGPVSRLSL